MKKMIDTDLGENRESGGIIVTRTKSHVNVEIRCIGHDGPFTRVTISLNDSSARDLGSQLMLGVRKDAAE